MSEPSDHDVAEGTAWGAHLRAIRRDMSVLIDNQRRTFEHVRRLSELMANVQSDLVLFENRDLSRQGEVLSILERLDLAGIPSRPMFGLEAAQILATKEDPPERG